MLRCALVGRMVMGEADGYGDDSSAGSRDQHPADLIPGSYNASCAPLSRAHEHTLMEIRSAACLKVRCGLTETRKLLLLPSILVSSGLALSHLDFHSDKTWCKHHHSTQKTHSGWLCI